MAKKLENQTEEELLAAKEALNAQRAALRQDALAIQAELDERAVRAKVDALSDDEKRQLVQVIQADGLVSEEQTGKLGG